LARRCGHGFGAVDAFDGPADVGDRLAGETHRVGAHVGDEADRAFPEVDALIEPLRRAHRALRAEAELARRFLLQRRGRERRRGIALALFLLDAGDRECTAGGSFQRAPNVLGARAVGDRELLDLLAAELGEARGERLLTLLGLGIHRPVLARHKRCDLFLALADHAQRRALHAACRGAGQTGLLPQQRREVEADQVVERAPREVRLDQASAISRGVDRPPARRSS
jgi:hypothetical protein